MIQKIFIQSMKKIETIDKESDSIHKYYIAIYKTKNPSAQATRGQQDTTS